jgi:hypothetical protein
MSSNLPVNAARIAEDIDALARLTEPGRPWTRRVFSPLFLEGLRRESTPRAISLAADWAAPAPRAC